MCWAYSVCAFIEFLFTSVTKVAFTQCKLLPITRVGKLAPWRKLQMALITLPCHTQILGNLPEPENALLEGFVGSKKSRVPKGFLGRRCPLIRCPCPERATRAISRKNPLTKFQFVAFHCVRIRKVIYSCPRMILPRIIVDTIRGIVGQCAQLNSVLVAWFHIFYLQFVFSVLKNLKFGISFFNCVVDLLVLRSKCERHSTIVRFAFDHVWPRTIALVNLISRSCYSCDPKQIEGSGRLQRWDKLWCSWRWSNRSWEKNRLYFL